MDIVKVFGDNVREIRIQKNLSQEKLAELSGLHRTYISGIERCGRNISLENVQRIADALEIETYKLLVENKAASQNKVKKGK
ncbi:helix-turn-helix transcriptional regulator [bacterium]|nr:helix-turn-helix transcriptional regulator [bacterium]